MFEFLQILEKREAGEIFSRQAAMISCFEKVLADLTIQSSFQQRKNRRKTYPGDNK